MHRLIGYTLWKHVAWTELSETTNTDITYSNDSEHDKSPGNPYLCESNVNDTENLNYTTTTTTSTMTETGYTPAPDLPNSHQQTFSPSNYMVTETRQNIIRLYPSDQTFIELSRTASEQCITISSNQNIPTSARKRKPIKSRTKWHRKTKLNNQMYISATIKSRTRRKQSTVILTATHLASISKARMRRNCVGIRLRSHIFFRRCSEIMNWCDNRKMCLNSATKNVLEWQCVWSNQFGYTKLNLPCVCIKCSSVNFTVF